MFIEGKSELVTTYRGTPADIINALIREMGDVLERNGIQPTGVHLVAMMHLIVGAVKAGIEDPAPQLGKMPSFKFLLMILTKNMEGSNYTPEETQLFKEEFTRLVESLGGHQIAPEPYRKEITYMSPPSKEVH